MQNKRVAFAKALLTHIVDDDGVAAASYLQDGGTIFPLEVEVAHAAVDGWEAGRKHHFNALQALAPLFARDLLFAVFPTVGEQARRGDVYIKESDNGNDDAHFSKFKHGEAGISSINDHAVYNEVCACSDERTHAAKDGGV